MGFLSREQSVCTSQPLELYAFTMGEQVWRYTSADHVVTYNGVEYSPVFISRGGFSRGNDLNRSAMEVDVAITDSLSMPFRTGLLPNIMLMRLTRVHYGDTEGVDSWYGRVIGCKWHGSVATLIVDSAATILRRAGLRRVYQVTCPHAMYSDSCGVNKNNYQFDSTVSVVDGNVVTVIGASGFPAGYFIGGYVLSGVDQRLITNQVGGVITMIDVMPDLLVDDAVSMWPGCDRNLLTCKNRFNNYLNYGGLPFIPPKNPFSGDAIA